MSLGSLVCPSAVTRFPTVFVCVFLCPRHFQWKRDGRHIISPLSIRTSFSMKNRSFAPFSTSSSSLYVQLVYFKTQVYNHKGQVGFRVKSANLYGSYAPYSTSLFAKCLFAVVGMATRRGHLCRIDMLLVCCSSGEMKIFNFIKTNDLNKTFYAKILMT